MATVDELYKAQTASQNTESAPNANTPAVTEGEKRINDMFDAQKQSQLNQLKASYDQSLSEHQAARDKISPQYQTAANDLGVQHERNKRNLNMQVAANGINTGTASQMALAQNNEHLRDFGKLRASESEALAAADRGIANLTTNYQNNISAAVADNDYKKAAALLDEYNTQYNRDMKQAEALASYGDFSMYAKLYGEEQAKAMREAWLAQYPQLAFMTGNLTEAEYNNLINGRPKDFVGGAVAASSGGSGKSASDILREQTWQIYNDIANNPKATEAEIQNAYNDASQTVSSYRF